ncbi:MAG TPA: hypothetical protein VGG89_15400 [Candidatus Baltobacteraceae bacterium]
MSAYAAIAIVLTAVAWIEVAIPGRDLYHTGWFNVALAALVVICVAGARRRNLVVALGAAVVAGATIAGGLFAPDNHTVVGAPGQRVRVDDLGGTLAFPFAQPRTSRQQVAFLGPPLTTFVLHPVERSVVYVEARDARQNRLTVTQPTGTAFLSPVLLMQQQQQIAGLMLPYDSFAVPAAHRIVKAVLFSPQQAAMLRGIQGLATGAVLFAVDDDNDRPLPHAIALCVDGQSVTVGGLLLHADILQYPAIEVVAVPSLVAAGIGTLLVFGGLFAMRRQTRKGS